MGTGTVTRAPVRRLSSSREQRLPGWSAWPATRWGHVSGPQESRVGHGHRHQLETGGIQLGSGRDGFP